MSIPTRTCILKASVRRAYAAIRYKEAMEHVGATDDIFVPPPGQKLMSAAPHIRAKRRAVYERMLEIIDGRRVSHCAIAEHIGCNRKTIDDEMRRPVVRCLTMLDAIRIRDAAFRQAGFDPMLMNEKGAFPERDHAVWLMRQRQPCGLRLPIKMVALAARGIPLHEGRGSSWVCDCIKRHLARGARQEAA